MIWNYSKACRGVEGMVLRVMRGYWSVGDCSEYNVSGLTIQIERLEYTGEV